MADDEMSRADAASWLVRIANDLRCAGDMPLVRMNANGVETASMSLADELWLVAFCLVRPTPHGRPAVADDMNTPEEWESAPVEGPHDHKGHSEEKCVRCGWVMGHRPLNCMNDDTPHRFPSQEAEIERLRAALAIAAGMISTLPPYEDQHPEAVMEMLLEEARRG